MRTRETPGRTGEDRIAKCLLSVHPSEEAGGRKCSQRGFYSATAALKV